MKLKHHWQRRLLCFLLAFAVFMGGVFCCLPVSAGAIVPIGLVQSALASYVASTGYKLWNDQGTGQDMLAALSDLYQTWLDVSDPVGALTLDQMSQHDYVYLDTSGQIVIRKAAADMFQQFSDWIQTEYSVPVGSDVPTEVVTASGGSLSDGNGFNCILVETTNGPISGHGSNWYYSSLPIGVITDTASDYYNNSVYFFSKSSTSFYLTSYDLSNYGRVLYLRTVSGGRFSGVSIGFNNNGMLYDFAVDSSSYSGWYWISPGSSVSLTLPVSTVIPDNIGDLESSGGVAGLGVTLAQAVTDVVGQATDDDAVVIGVGAGVGATASDIANLVAQGVKAQTLTPSVSITAEAVIDTPVQPYPDIDGLGLPTLGAALVSRFPFCVPWDFVDTLKILNADPIPPVFDVTLVPASVAARWGVSGNYTVHVDLTSQEYAKLFVALRWGTLVGFCLGLALLTKRLIWTA